MPHLSYLGWNLLAFAPMWLIRSPAFDVWQSTAAMAGCLFWLGAIWVLLAWIHQKSTIFTAGQIVMTAASVLATLSWLEWQQWIASFLEDIFSRTNLQAFGIGLGLLSLAWMAVRIVSRLAIGGDENQKAENRAVRKWQHFLAPSGNWAELMRTRPEIDKIATYVVVVVQLVLIGGILVHGCGQELITSAGRINPLQISACGGCAWTLLGVLTLLAVAALWERWGYVELQMSLLLTVSVPVLIADRFVNDLAVASAARWALAVCFLVCSSAVWSRKWLKNFGDMIHAQMEISEQGPSTCPRHFGCIVGHCPCCCLLFKRPYFNWAVIHHTDPWPEHSSIKSGRIFLTLCRWRWSCSD